MAISKNPLLKGLRGHINKVIVIKQYPGDRTIISAYPDMSKVKPSEAQLAAKDRFAAAVSYAKNILSSAEEKSEAQNRLKQRKGSLYHALISENMKAKLILKRQG